MPQPPLVARVCDDLTLMLNGGMRVRVWCQNGQLAAHARGKAARLAHGDAVRLIMELDPDLPGTVDIKHEDGAWRVNVSGISSDRAYAQRLRNVLINRA